MTPSIYINLEDDVSAIATRLRRERSKQVILVCPKRCYLFSNPVNLKLLKTQVDLLGKEIFILTMDKDGQAFAQAAGFGLRFLPKAGKQTMSDINLPVKETAVSAGQTLINKQQSAVSKSEPQSNLISKFFLEASGKKNAAERASIAAQGPQIAVSSMNAEASFAATTDKNLDEVPEASIKDSIFPKELEQAYREQRQRKNYIKIFAGLTMTALLVVLALVFIILPKATVIVYPKTETISRDMDVNLSTIAQTSDSSKLILPAVFVSESMEVSDSFQSQGKKEVGNKAAGTVKIYNFSKASINLKSNTTILTVGGKSYNLIPDIVTIKPTQYKNAKTKEVDENSLGESVPIKAAEGGENSNLPAGTRLEITNQVFGSKPQILYAKTDTPVEGGVSRFLSVVTDADLQTAQTTLKNKILSQIRNKLTDKNLVLLDNSYSLQNPQFSADKPAGTESPTFQASLKTSVAGLAFNKDDMEKLVMDRIKQTLSDNKTLQTDPDLINNYKIKSIDLSAQAAVVFTHFEAKAVQDININDLPGLLVGKTETQVDDILKSRSEIDRIDVTLAPSWQKTFPWFKSKITVLLGS